MDRLRSLSEIEVFGCLSLEALFESISLSSKKKQKPLELSALKNLKLLNLPRLTDILKSDCEETLTFPSLMEVNVRRCHSLSYLFSSTTAKTLHELVALDVSCCNNLRGIIVMKEGKGKTAEIFEFRHLTKLKLGDLKSLICFSSENCAGDGLYPLFDEKVLYPDLSDMLYFFVFLLWFGPNLFWVFSIYLYTLVDCISKVRRATHRGSSTRRTMEQ